MRFWKGSGGFVARGMTIKYRGGWSIFLSGSVCVGWELFKEETLALPSIASCNAQRANLESTRCSYGLAWMIIIMQSCRSAKYAVRIQELWLMVKYHHEHPIIHQCPYDIVPCGHYSRAVQIHLSDIRYLCGNQLLLGHVLNVGAINVPFAGVIHGWMDMITADQMHWLCVIRSWVMIDMLACDLWSILVELDHNIEFHDFIIVGGYFNALKAFWQMRSCELDGCRKSAMKSLWVTAW